MGTTFEQSDTFCCLETGTRTYFNDAGWDECEYRIIAIGNQLWEFRWDVEHHYGPTIRVYKLGPGCEFSEDPDHDCQKYGCNEEYAYMTEGGVPFHRWDESRDIPATFREWHIMTPQEMIHAGFAHLS